MEITTDINLTEKQRAQMELHSFLNILNILMGEFQLIRLDLDQPNALPQSFRMVELVLRAIKQGCLDKDMALRMASIGFYFTREVDEALELEPRHRGEPELKESVGNVNSIIHVMTLRLQEYFERVEIGLNWVAHPADQLTDKFMRFFAAVEKNSKGRYHILFNVAARESTDYLINFKIEGASDNSVFMPSVIHDIFRDLIANARKYTPPGGEINAGLLQTVHELRLVVEDNGSGIPENEISKVVEFGYRAESTKEHLTRGGGFGLTKAYAFTRQLGGRMWIESEIGHGTRVTIRIPVPAHKG